MSLIRINILDSIYCLKLTSKRGKVLSYERKTGQQASAGRIRVRTNGCAESPYNTVETVSNINSILFLFLYVIFLGPYF